ncbi:MAG: transporter, family, putative rane transport protein [Marmoricola sp.]|nr:transporter, family, putative rane transport protein [Marmoricola sp.]
MVLAGLAAFGLLYAAQPVLPQLGEEYGVGPSAASLAVSAPTGALALAVLPAAALAVRWGRVRVMRVGLVLSVVLTAAVAAAPDFTSLVVLRALSGVALAAVVAVAMGHVGAEVHPVGLGSAMGLYVAGNTLGGVGGRLVTAGVSDGSSWRSGVAALAVLAALVTAAFWRLLPEPVAEDAAGTAGRTGERTGDRGLLRWLLGRPELLALVVVPFTLMGGFVAVYNYLGYRLSAAPFDLAPAVLGLVFLAYLAGTVASASAGRAADRLGRPRVLVSSVLVMVAGLLLTLPDQLVLVVVGLVVLTAGFFGAHATASGWAPVVAAPYGTQGSALYVCAYYAGSSVFGLALGQAWAGAGWGGVVVSVGVLAAVALGAGAVVSAAMRRRPR